MPGLPHTLVLIKFSDLFYFQIIFEAHFIITNVHNVLRDLKVTKNIKITLTKFIMDVGNFVVMIVKKFLTQFKFLVNIDYMHINENNHPNIPFLLCVIFVEKF